MSTGKGYIHVGKLLQCSIQQMVAKPRQHFAYQWLDNVKIIKFAKFDQIYHAVQEL